MRSRASIIWLNYNSRRFIDIVIESLQSIFDIDYPNLELIIVDNGSTDGSFDTIKEFVEKKKRLISRVKLIRVEKNLGFAGGVNTGFKARDPDSKYLVLLNNDAVPEPTSLGRMIEVLEVHEKLGAIQGIIVQYRNSQRIDTAGGFITELLNAHPALKNLNPKSVNNAFYVTYADGAYSVYKIDAIAKALNRTDKLFYDFAYAYLDDNYLGLKLWNAGFRVASIPIISAKHNRGSTFKRTNIQLYLDVRARVALNTITNSRWKHFVEIIQMKHLNEDTSLGRNVLLAIRSGKKLGRLLKMLGERIDLYKAPTIEIPIRVLPSCLISRRKLEEYITKKLTMLINGPLRFRI